MKATKDIVIVKRDGAVESFSRAKLRRVIANGMRTCHYDPKLADPLVEAVEVHLQYWEDPRPPTTEYVFRCVYAVLKQTGLQEIGDCLAAHRRWRRTKRRATRVLREAPKRGSKPWRKSALIATLEDRHGLGHTTARIVASELESRVLNLGFKTLPQSLLAELIQTELMAWGLWDEAVPNACSSEQERA